MDETGLVRILAPNLKTGNEAMADLLRLPELSPATVADRRETDYPREFKKIVAGRARRACADALGLQQFSVILALLALGATLE